MAYNEQIKNLKNFRSYIRQFFVGGFKKAKDYIYDNQENKTDKNTSDENISNENISNGKTSKSNFRYIKKKIDNCLGESMKFDCYGKGKIFLSTDSKTIKTNPFYDIFKAKSFTENDIILRFLIMDYLADGDEHTLADIIGAINNFESIEFSVDTCKNKIKEFTEFGLIVKNRTEDGIKYRIVKHSDEELKEIEKLKNAIVFFSEADPLGVIGYYIMEMFGNYPDLFRFKQKYIFRAIDSEVLYHLVCAIESKTPIEIEVVKEYADTQSRKKDIQKVLPYKIYISSQSGRQYLFCWEIKSKNPSFVRIDRIETVKKLSEESELNFKELDYNIKNNLWGVSSKFSEKTEHIEFLVKIEENEQYILDKLINEKRCGTVEKVENSENLWKFSADVYDTLEIVVWIRTFIGRIYSISCENEKVLARLKKDFQALCDAYDIENGGDNNVIS